MTATPNGQPVASVPTPDDLRTEVAKALLAASSDETWDDLSDEEREQFLAIADHAQQAQLNGLISRNFKVVPPGAVMKPATPEEATAMLRVAQSFLAERARKPSLAPRKLIVPGRAH